MANINIYSWDDFSYYTASTKPTFIKDSQNLYNSTDTVRFGDTYLDENNNFIGDGAGTREDPYICGTYYEMRCATGAPNIYSLQLVENGDDENGYHLYYYPKANKYARHDRSNTTIDFNIAQYPGVNNICIHSYINFNGWTFENLNFFPGARFVFKTAERIYIYNMILLKCTAEASSTGSPFHLFDSGYTGSSSATAYTVSVRDSIIQVDLQHGATSTGAGVGTYLLASKYYDANMYRCTVAISGRVGPFNVGYSPQSNYGAYIYDCNFNMDLNMLFGIENKAYFYNCKFTGQQTVRSSSSTNSFGYQLNNCIVDMFSWLKADGSSEPTKHSVRAGQQGTITVYNTDKATSNTDNFIGLDSENINNPSALRSIGFPIGSDEINGESNV